MVNKEVVISGKDIFDITKIKGKEIGRDKDFVYYKITIFYNGKQFTFNHFDVITKPLDKSRIFHQSLLDINDYLSCNNFKVFKESMNYLNSDEELAKKDYLNRKNLYKGFTRVYGNLIGKLFRYFGI